MSVHRDLYDAKLGNEPSVPPRVLCAGTGEPAEARQGCVYVYCPVCGRDFGTAGTRQSKSSQRRGNPWKTGIPRHYVAATTGRPER
jgi:hypothetical protein